MNAWIKTVATFFFIGTLPVAPGTWGTAAGLLIAWGLTPALPVLLVVFCLAGFLVCRPAQSVLGSSDPSRFVMDEVCGMMMSVLWLPKDAVLYLAAFVLFRVFDVVKPWPISLIQKSKNPLSIMWDDLAAGVLVNIILQLFLKIQS